MFIDSDEDPPRELVKISNICPYALHCMHVRSCARHEHSPTIVSLAGSISPERFHSLAFPRNALLSPIVTISRNRYTPPR
mmetsp:Transcript_10100/g.37628  ORF Transcript_10100/g.37628 Transcript_10100/m.37628 type:complete len:80 (+) Transcript_10100:80-319(+)